MAFSLNEYLTQKKSYHHIMIKISKKSDCCGCGACMQKCPKKCISLTEDEQGFLYPSVNEDICVNCGLCEKVCPVLNKWNTKTPTKIFACKNTNEEQRLISSSGGVFIIIAENVINRGGVVFGARFDSNWNVIHSYTERKEELSDFQGSKYVQSRIGDSYQKCKKYLDEKREVLFTGTPCQIAGLKHYLGRGYDNLLTVEVMCHGVPSPRVWRDYLTSIQRPKGAGAGKNTVLSSLNETSSIEGISFRDKQTGWKKYGFVVRYSAESREAEKFGMPSVNNELREYHKNNLFMKGFLKNLYLRPSCFECPAKGGSSKADLSLGDFWSVDSYIPDYNDDKGITLVYINSVKGEKNMSELSCDAKELDSSLRYNRMYYGNSNVVYPLNSFWEKYEENGLAAIHDILSSLKPSLYKRFVNYLNKVFKLRNRK